MRLPRIQFTVRRLIVAAMVLAVFVACAAVPLWNYYSVPPNTRAVLTMLGQKTCFASTRPISLDRLLKAIKAGTTGPTTNNGLPIYVDPAGLAEAGTTLDATVLTTTDVKPLNEHLDASLGSLGLGYFVEDGLVTITSAKAAQRALRSHSRKARRP